MDETDFTLTSEDGEQLFVYRWSGDGAPRAAVQIAHGMGEHAARYARLAEALVDEGYVVYANDHRGHGRTAGTPERHGDVGAAGWAGLVDDLALVVGADPRRAPGHPARAARPQHGLVRPPAAPARPQRGHRRGRAVGDVGHRRDRRRHRPTKEADLTAFNAPFEPARTDYDWLSRDDAEVDAYVADPACGFGLSIEGMGGMLGGAAATADPQRLGAIRSDLPIYLFSGDADPIAGGGALVELVGQRYRDAGVADVTVKLYPGARHETLNETNRDEVTADLIAWLDGATKGATT